MPKITKQVGATKTKPKIKTRARSDSVIDRIGDGWPEDEGIKICIYGKSGSGKTTLLSTFPGDILHINCSGKGELRSIPKALRSKIKPVVLKHTNELKELVEHQKETEAFGTIALDHLTAFADLVFMDVLEIDEVPVQKGWGSATQQQWGTIGAQMKEYLRDMTRLSCNVVFLAQERDFNTESNSELILPTVGAAVSPSVAGWVNAACDYIVQTFIREATTKKTVEMAGKKKEVLTKTGGFEYCIRTGPHSVYTTKFRIPKGVKLPDAIVDPTYDKIMALING